MGFLRYHQHFGSESAGRGDRETATPGCKRRRNAQAGRVRVGSQAGRIGLMSTQRRENRRWPASWKDSAVTRERGRSGWATPQSELQGIDGTAPRLQNQTGFAAERVATKSLPMEYRTIRLPRKCMPESNCGLTPLRARCRVQIAAPSAGSPSEAHPLACRRCAPPFLAAYNGSPFLPNGKARWQKKFVSPARRMKRGLQF